MAISDFNKDLEWSTCDEVRRKNYSIIIRHFPVKKIDFQELEKNKKPNDVVVELIDGTKINVELKNYKEGAYWHQIFLEIWNNILKEPYSWGWTFKLAESHTDYILFTWHGKMKECYLLLDAKKLGQWWLENYMNYKEIKNGISTNGKSEWRSSFAVVPISNIPDDMIIFHKKFTDLNDFWRT